MDPLNLDAVQKRKTVSFFYEGQSEFLVRVAPHASPRSPYHRSPLAPSQPVSARNCTVRRSRSAPLAAWAGAATSFLAARQHKLTNAPRRLGRRRMPHCRPHLPRHGLRSHHRRLPRHHRLSPQSLRHPHLPRQILHHQACHEPYCWEHRRRRHRRPPRTRARHRRLNRHRPRRRRPPRPRRCPLRPSRRHRRHQRRRIWLSPRRLRPLC